jgi:hypothetical protein
MEGFNAPFVIIFWSDVTRRAGPCLWGVTLPGFFVEKFSKKDFRRIA